MNPDPVGGAVKAAAGHEAGRAFRPLGSRLLRGAGGTLAFSAFDILDSSRTGMQRIGGVIGTAAGTAAMSAFGSAAGAAIGTAIAGPLGGLVTGAIGMAIDYAIYTGSVWTFGKMEKMNRLDAQRMRDATRAGFHASDTFHSNESMVLTQRMAAVRAMQGSILNARSSIGNEAMMMRRSVDEYL